MRTFRLFLTVILAALCPGQPAQPWTWQGGLSLPLPDTNQAKHYVKLKSRNSLLIYDCSHSGLGNWCQDTAFSFDSILTLAAKLPQPSMSVDAMKGQIVSTGLHNGIWPPGIFMNGTIDSTQLVPLAVVNRMDLADWRGDDASGQWRGAELRFIYGYQQNFTLTVEIALPDASWSDFQQQALAWEALSDSSDLIDDLKAKVLPRTRFQNTSQITIRVNRSETPSDRTVSWIMGQWTINAHGLNETSLTDQVSNLKSAKYLALWSAGAWIPSGSTSGTVQEIPIPEELQPLGKTYNGGGDIPGLATDLVPKPVLRVRNILGLQQCTLCHSSETGTLFQHVRKNDDGSIELSKFLTGLNGKEDPLLTDLPNQVLPVTVNYFCTPTTTCPTTRSFHDLARRKLFLAYLLAANGPSEVDAIRKFRVDYAD